MTPLPPEEIAPLVRFIAEKSKNVASRMNIQQLCRQFNEVTGSSLGMGTFYSRIKSIRHRIHKMDEFDMVTKVKMLFALGAPIDMGFLIELKKVAYVKVDDLQRITEYTQKDGKLELIARNLKLSINQGAQRGKSIIQFLAEKSRTVDDPMPDRVFLREFKEKTGCPDLIETLWQRYRRLRNTIYYLSEIDMKTRIKMMFVSNVQVSDFILKLLRKDGEVEVDEQGRITKYTANDGSLELEGDHSFSAMRKRAAAIKRQRLAGVSKERKRAKEVSEGDHEESLKVEDDSAMDFDFNNAGNFDYDAPNNKEDPDHIPVEQKPEFLLEIKTEVPSTGTGGHYQKENFFDYDPPYYEENMEYIPEERKPESLIEVKMEAPDEPSASNHEYHFEENLENVLIEAKPETF